MRHGSLIYPYAANALRKSNALYSAGFFGGVNLIRRINSTICPS